MKFPSQEYLGALVSALNFYKGVLEYRGTGFLGWQIQSRAAETVQGQINQALGRICKSESIKTVGASRTDAGVHARMQWVRMEIPLDIDPDALMRGLNSLLPATISFLKIECCSPSFHPIRDAGKKEYHYLFSSQSQLSPFWVDLIAHYPHALDLSKMQAAAALFIGQHDFANFYCTGSETPTTERTIYLSEITNVSSLDVGGVVIPEHYLFKVAGNGFLKQMVRLLIGAIWEVGRGRVSLEELAHAISLQTEGKIGVVAPPQGLYLKSIGG